MMIKEQMEEAVSEARELLVRLEDGTLEPDLEPQERSGIGLILRRILRDREAWLRGEVITATGIVAANPENEVGRQVKFNLRDVQDGADMFTKSTAIGFLRSRNSLNHEPLRQVEQEWLDRIFIRERMSRAWIGLASTMADPEEEGIHIENHQQAPCKCLDSAERKLKENRSTPFRNWR